MKTAESSSSHEENIEISPFVKSMKTGVNMPANFDYKKEYREHFYKKYS